jgi:hypothetical protein
VDRGALEEAAGRIRGVEKGGAVSAVSGLVVGGRVGITRLFRRIDFRIAHSRVLSSHLFAQGIKSLKSNALSDRNNLAVVVDRGSADIHFIKQIAAEVEVWFVGVDIDLI